MYLFTLEGEGDINLQPVHQEDGDDDLEGIAVAAESHFRDLADGWEANRRIAIRRKFGGRIPAEQFDKMARSTAETFKIREKAYLRRGREQSISQGRARRY